MKKIRIGNDFVFIWAIERNGLPEDLSSIVNASLTVTVLGKVKTIPFEVIDGGLRIEFTPSVCDILGVYNLEFSYELPDDGLSDLERQCKIDVDAFQIVPKSAMADDASEFVVTSDMAIGFMGEKGDSAYQVWLDAGNTGTVEDFLLSLKGEKGDMADVSMTINEFGDLIATIYN